MADKYINADSPSVSKDEFKRFRRIFNSTGSGHTLSEVEEHNAYAMMKSNKKFTDKEIRRDATNPSGRVGTAEDAAKARRQQSIDYAKSRRGKGRK